MQDYKGTILEFNETVYNSTLSAYNPLLRSIDEVGRQYQELDTTFEFSQAVFKDILARGTKGIEQQYSDRIEAQLKQSKFTSKAMVQQARDSVKLDLTVLQRAVEDMHNKRQQASTSSSMYTYEIDFKYIRIIGGKATIPDDQKEIIKEVYTVRVKADQENIMWNKLQDIKTSFEDFTGFMKKMGFSFELWNIVGNNQGALLFENNGSLNIRTDAITFRPAKPRPADADQVIAEIMAKNNEQNETTKQELSNQ